MTPTQIALLFLIIKMFWRLPKRFNSRFQTNHRIYSKIIVLKSAIRNRVIRLWHTFGIIILNILSRPTSPINQRPHIPSLRVQYPCIRIPSIKNIQQPILILANKLRIIKFINSIRSIFKPRLPTNPSKFFDFPTLKVDPTNTVIARVRYI